MAHYVVMRGPCYLALRALTLAGPSSVDGLVLITEPGRALGARDVEGVIGRPIVTEVPVDAAVARGVDAGCLLDGRLPRSLRAVEQLARRHGDTSCRPDGLR